MIEISTLKESNKGKWVKYTTPHGTKEQGKIKSWNSSFIFIVYNYNNEWDEYQKYTAAATSPQTVCFIDSL